MCVRDGFSRFSGVPLSCAAAGLNDAETYQLARGNAIDAFGLSRFGIEH